MSEMSRQPRESSNKRGWTLEELRKEFGGRNVQPPDGTTTVIVKAPRDKDEPSKPDSKESSGS